MARKLVETGYGMDWQDDDDEAERFISYYANFGGPAAHGQSIEDSVRDVLAFQAEQRKKEQKEKDARSS